MEGKTETCSWSFKASSGFLADASEATEDKCAALRDDLFVAFGDDGSFVPRLESARSSFDDSGALSCRGDDGGVAMTVVGGLS
ncbi:hypothetical protein CCR75_008257 [Bremia lactucae]|uniref:Uncharacterized protein n=1 Tax=Bremia lactucae TaxID=4779 RepID=A0A976ILQ2_BRELC|nr:hypothetical protein CCR75_008257 [Bremia lactucae]